MGFESRHRDDYPAQEGLVEELARVHRVELTRAREVLRRAEDAAEEDPQARSVRHWFAFLLAAEPRVTSPIGKRTALEARIGDRPIPRAPSHGQQTPEPGRTTLVMDGRFTKDGRVAHAPLEEPAATPELGFDDYRVLGLRAMLRGLGANHPLRRDLVAAAAASERSIAGRATLWREPLSANPTAAGHALRGAADRHAATLYRRAMDRGAIDPEDPAVEAVLRQRASGQPLPMGLCREMEDELGVSLAGVRVHTDAVAAQAARALDAEAFTLGEDIFFAEGAFDPQARSGRKLLAHELAHVAQVLRGQTPAAGGALRVSQPDDPLEREADAMADRIDAAPARPLDGGARAARPAPARAAAVTSPAPSPASPGAIQRAPGNGQPLVPEMTIATEGTTARISVLGQLVATVNLPGGQALNARDLWMPSTGKYALSVECAFGGKITLNQAGIDALTRMVPHISGAISAHEKGVETPYDVLKFASFGRGAAKPSASKPAPPAPSAGGDQTQKGPPEGTPGLQPTSQSQPPDGPSKAGKPNPYAAMTVEERARKVTELLGHWFTGGEILQAFQACNPRDFIVLQEKVNLAAVVDKLGPWELVRLGALGPLLASQRQRVNEARADLIQDITHSWGVERAQIFVHYIFNTMPDDDAVSVLKLLAAGQHLHETLDGMPEVGKLLDGRGIDRSKIRDRGWEALDIARGIGRGLGDLMSTSEAARGAEGSRAMSMKLDLPSPYQEAVDKVDEAAFMRAMTPGNIAFGTLDYATMGLLGAAKGVVYDIPKGIASGVEQIADGHVASGVEQLTGPAIFIVGAVLGVRGFRKSARMAAMLELTEEGQALYGPLKARLGAQGIDKVAKWAQGSSEAQILVRQEGAAGIEALYRAQGDVAAARAELSASRTGAGNAASTTATTTASESTAADASKSTAGKGEPAAAGAGESATAGRTVDTSNKVAKTSTGYRLNRKNIQNYEKIRGEPESIVEADANREALAAEQAASKSSVQKVFLGTEADQLINGNQGQAMSADVVAVNKKGQYYVYEAKGMNIEHGLEQLEHTAQQLGPSRVVRQTLVVPERINTPGYTVKDGILHLGDKPVSVAGKPVNVIFTTQQ